MEPLLTQEKIEQMREIRWYHRIPLGKDRDGNQVITPGCVRHGEDDSDYASYRFGIPNDLKGLEIADIGGWDGYFSFEAEKRGAKCVTLFEVGEERGGNWGGTRGFQFAKSILNSKVQFVDASIYELTPTIGIFDVTLFFGVLYHLKAPLLALEALFSITKKGGYSLIETEYVEDDLLLPNWQFLPGHRNDPTNYFYPNMIALKQSLFFVGYKNVSIVYDNGQRCTLKAVK